jgi:hypothetical protein
MSTSSSKQLCEVEADQLDVERAAAQIAQCKNLDELRDIRDKSRAIEAYQRARGASVQAQQDAAEIALRAERRLGELCKEVTGGKGSTGGKVKNQSAGNTLLLADLDITKAQSSRWQKLARIEETDFDGAIENLRYGGERVTAGAVSRESERAATVAAGFMPQRPKRHNPHLPKDPAAAAAKLKAVFGNRWCDDLWRELRSIVDPRPRLSTLNKRAIEVLDDLWQAYPNERLHIERVLRLGFNDLQKEEDRMRDARAAAREQKKLEAAERNAERDR